VFDFKISENTLHVRRINDHDAGAEPREPGEELPQPHFNGI
jgi:hypothetical protein